MKLNCLFKMIISLDVLSFFAFRSFMVPRCYLVVVIGVHTRLDSKEYLYIVKIVIENGTMRDATEGWGSINKRNENKNEIAHSTIFCMIRLILNEG